ncbi:MAG: hypothetical protein LBU11_06295 [Zoogloeaceae bacterium]|jgi:hypothetical protein|nr:hypothetical protein [Zoogloeaceae bacterium]
MHTLPDCGKPAPRFVVNVLPAGEDEVQCIRIAHPSRLYVTNDLIPTHNTYGSKDGVVRLTGKELGNFPDTPEGLKALREAAIKRLQEMKEEMDADPSTAFDAPIIGKDAKIGIRGRGIREVKRYSANPDKLRLIPALRELIANAHEKSWELNYKRDSKPRIEGYYTLKSRVILGGREQVIDILIEKDDQGMFHYDFLLDRGTASEEAVQADGVPASKAGDQPDKNIAQTGQNSSASPRPDAGENFHTRMKESRAKAVEELPASMRAEIDSAIADGAKPVRKGKKFFLEFPDGDSYPIGTAEYDYAMQQKGAPSYSFASPVSNPESVSGIRVAIEKALGKKAANWLIGSKRIVPHETPDSLPEGLASAVSRSGGKVSGLYDPKTGQIHLVSSWIQRGEGAAKLGHEGWHMFLDALKHQNGKAHKTMMNRLAFIAKSKGEIGQWFEKAKARIPARDRRSEEVYLNELAAYAIEEYERAPRSLPQAIVKWVQDFIAEIRAALIRHGFEVSSLTAADLAAISRQFLRQQATVRENQTVQTFPDGKVLASVEESEQISSPADVGLRANSTVWKNYQETLRKISALEDEAVSYQVSNSRRSARFERDGKLVDSLVLVSPNPGSALSGKNQVVAEIPKTKEGALIAMRLSANRTLMRKADEFLLERERLAVVREGNKQRKTILERLSSFLSENEKRIRNAHHNRELAFRSLPESFDAQSPSLPLHRSPMYFKKLGSHYDLVEVDGKPSYVRTSDHFGEFYTREHGKPSHPNDDDSDGATYMKWHNWTLDDGRGDGTRRRGYIPVEDIPEMEDEPRFSLASEEESEEELRQAFRDTERAYGGRTAYDQAKQAGRTKLNYWQWVQVRTPEFKKWFGDWEAAALRDFMNGKPVANIPGNQAPHTGFAALRKWATDIFAAQGGKAVSPELGDVLLDERAVRDSLGHGMNETKAEAFAAVKSAIEKGRIVQRGEKDGVPSIYVAAPVRIGGVDDVVIAVIRANEETNRMYLHSVVTKESLQGDRVKSGGAGSVLSGHSQLGGAYSIVQNALNFKGGVSRVIDEKTGEPMVVYHGGKEGIRAFRVHNVGAWFSSGREIPEIRMDRNGEIYPVFLSLKNPKSFASSGQFDAYFDGLVVEVRDAGSAPAYKDRLQAQGHDGISLEGTRADYGILDNQYVAFSPNQIKSATGNTGAFSSENDDIRFSVEQEEETDLEAAKKLVAEHSAMPRQARTFEDARKEALKFRGRPLKNADTGMVATLSGNNLDKMLSNSAARKSTSPEEHALAVANIDTLYQNAIKGWAKRRESDPDDLKATHRLFAPMQTDKGMRLVKLTMKEYAQQQEQGNRVYSVETIEVNESSPVPDMVDADRTNGSRLLTGLTGRVDSLVQAIQESNGVRFSVAQEEPSGHAQPLTAKVLTPSGFRFMGDIHVGDEVVTLDGGATRVTDVFPQGKKPIYRVVLSDGGETRCTADHLWVIQFEDGTGVMNTDRLMKGIEQGIRFKTPGFEPFS